MEKKDPQIKLSDAPTPQKLDLPTNMVGPVAEPGKANDNKPQPTVQEGDGQNQIQVQNQTQV